MGGAESPALARAAAVELAPRMHRGVLATAAGCGFAYGLAVRLFFGLRFGGDEAFGFLSLGFIFGLPFVLGFLVVALGERAGRWRWWWWLLVPWIPSLLCLAAALVLGWEGLICIVLWVPLFCLLASIGGLAAGLWGKWRRRGPSRGAIAAALLLPLFVAPAERLLPPPDEIRTVETTIDVAAGPAEVWRQIADVPAIAESERRFSWTHALGFPRPIAARCDGAGVGAVRRATFEHGVLFVETVSEWEPGRALAFTIHADPIPPGTLDEHVTVGGPYFDVLSGSYRIEALGPGRVRLHLASRHRLSTRFNFYSGLWTDFILRDTQRTILDILKRRAERGPLSSG
jgi:hypothetical protein